MNPERYYYENGRVESEHWKDEDGKTHRLDGPARQEWYDNGQLMMGAWRIHGTRHRLDGPAFQVWDTDGRLDREFWYINGVKYDTEAEFQVAVDLYKANEIAELF